MLLKYTQLWAHLKVCQENNTYMRISDNFLKLRTQRHWYYSSRHTWNICHHMNKFFQISKLQYIIHMASLFCMWRYWYHLDITMNDDMHEDTNKHPVWSMKRLHNAQHNVSLIWWSITIYCAQSMAGCLLRYVHAAAE